MADGKCPRPGRRSHRTSEGLPVVPGGGDVAALTVGCRVSAAGVLGITLGTAGHLVLAVDRKTPLTPGTGIWRLPHAEPGRAIWLAS
jgi:xylulokinase